LFNSSLTISNNQIENWLVNHQKNFKNKKETAFAISFLKIFTDSLI